MDENNVKVEETVVPEVNEIKQPENVNVTVTQAAVQKAPGEGPATTSMILGIISVALWFFGYTALVSMVLGILGLVFASKAKKLGYTGSKRTAGFVLSLIGLIVGGIVFVACTACVGGLAAIGAEL